MFCGLIKTSDTLGSVLASWQGIGSNETLNSLFQSRFHNISTLSSFVRSLRLCSNVFAIRIWNINNVRCLIDHLIELAHLKFRLAKMKGNGD